MKTIMVASTKGGTAKTTSVLALAAVWAVEHARRVAIWDGDPRASLTRQLREQTVADPWAADPVEVPIPEMRENAMLFRGGRVLGIADPERLRLFFERADWEDRLRADLAIIETGTAGVMGILAAADVADLVLVPVDTSPLGLEGLIETMKLLEVIEPPVPTRVLLTRVHPRRRITRRIMDHLDKHHPGLRLDVGIPEDARVPESQEERLPVVLDAPRDRASIAYREVAAHLLDVLAGLRRVPHLVNHNALEAGA